MKGLFLTLLFICFLSCFLCAQKKDGSVNVSGEKTLTTRVNVIENGDFSDGKTGFYSSYYFTSVNTTEGEYYVGKDASRWYTDHYSCGDHTNGKGKMLLVNGSPEENRIIWKTMSKIYPDRKYRFTFWITSISKPNPAILALVINGKEVSTFKSSGKPCIWESNSVVWNPDGSGSASISLINKNTARYGNDFALDDISFIETMESPISAPCEEKVSSAFSISVTNCNQVNFKLSQRNNPAIKSVKWNFGDGTYADEFNPSHIYKELRTYKASAITTTTKGCTDTTTSNITLSAFKASPIRAEEIEPDLFRFTTNIENARYTWNFGDNTVETDKQATLHRYKSSGEYKTVLKIQNNAGCIDSVSQAIKIGPLTASTKKNTPTNTYTSTIHLSSIPAFNTRKRELAKSLLIQQDSIRVLLSDNGIVDGDSITIVYDGRIILTHHLLSAKAFELKLPVPKDNQTHELVMYAENLGTIPPNTSLMVVYDGIKRYQVYIRASENSNAVVEFKRNP